MRVNAINIETNIDGSTYLFSVIYIRLLIKFRQIILLSGLLVFN